MDAFAVPGIPEISPGDDLADLVTTNVAIEDGDVVCVASTVVSKAEGRVADLSSYPAGPRAREIADRIGALTGETKDPRFAQAVLEESTELLMEVPFLLAETRFGHVGVNAGIDRSNVGNEGDILLLPERPNHSAARLRDDFPGTASVVITDTSGRAFRHGQCGVAIGWAGLPANRDWRGESDRHGYRLGVTVECIVDELAATANLLMGEGDGGTPVVVIRGFDPGDHDGDDTLYRDVERDYVRQALREWEYAGR